ncbi:hypothetical protein IWW38_002397, partial [Coemansia aciculifera]
MKLLVSVSLFLLSNLVVVVDAAVKCPSYADYSATPHGPYSAGRSRIPSMRPPPECRTFNSATIEQAIREVNSLITDPDWRQIFTNVFPNTLDTTVAWHIPDRKEPYTFLVTGDITAQWIRDSANQVLPYIPYASIDEDIAGLVLGLVNMQGEELLGYPYGNAFQPPPRSGLDPAENGIAVDLDVKPSFDNRTVFEAKFELDSFASFFQLSTAYWRATNDYQFMYSKSWSNAMAYVLTTIQKLQEPTFNKDHKLNDPLVQYTRWTDTATETQFGNGRGNPVRYTGMAKTLFRPSDDATIFPFLVPANAFLAVELNNLHFMLTSIGVYDEQAQLAKKLANEIRQGVLQYGTTTHPKYGRVFAYETDGFGSAL